MDPLTVIDMEFIASTLFPAIDKNIVKKMVAFNNQVSTYVHSLSFIFLAYLNHFSQYGIPTSLSVSATDVNHIEL